LDLKDVDTLSEGFSSRRANDGKIIFGMKRTEALERTVLWTQDARRISRALSESKDRSRMRAFKLEESKELSKDAESGKKVEARQDVEDLDP